ncbi:MAG: metalloregulator ArsR/SmtB family transcription factor [Candidatus Omnitrophota bacterium]
MRSRCLMLFKALADETRQEILKLLEDHDMNVGELCREFDSMTQPTVSHHLNILRNCHLVDSRRKGKMVYYYINKKVLKNDMQEFVESFELEITEL